MEDLEARLAEMSAKIDALYEAIAAVDEEGRRADFDEKWGEKIAGVDVGQKKKFGEAHSEEPGLWDYHNKHLTDEGYDEDAVIGGYLDELQAKNDALFGKAEALPEGPEADAALESLGEAQAAIDAGDETAAEEAQEDAEEEIAAAEEETPEDGEAEEADPDAPLADSENEEEIEKALSSDLLLNL